MSTLHPYSTTSATAIVADPQCSDHALYLDSSLVGFARTAHEAQTILDQLALVDEVSVAAFLAGT